MMTDQSLSTASNQYTNEASSAASRRQDPLCSGSYINIKHESFDPTPSAFPYQLSTSLVHRYLSTRVHTTHLTKYSIMIINRLVEAGIRNEIVIVYCIHIAHMHMRNAFKLF